MQHIEDAEELGRPMQSRLCFVFQATNCTPCYFVYIVYRTPCFKLQTKLHYTVHQATHWAGSLKKNTALEYSSRVVQEGGRRCKKSTLNDLVHLTSLRIPLMNPPIATHCTPSFTVYTYHATYRTPSYFLYLFRAFFFTFS